MDNIIIFLNGDRGLAVAEEVARTGHQVSAIVHGKPLSSELSCRALKITKEIFFLQDVNSEESMGLFSSRCPRLFIVAGYAQIFSAELISLPLLGTINLHAGRVPQYRGGSPLNWQLINGERYAGISILRMTEGIDSGEVLAKADFKIGKNDDISLLHDKANKLFPKLVIDVLIRFDRSDFSGAPQDNREACYWHQRSDADGEIKFASQTAEEVDRFVRALSAPYPGAWAMYGSFLVRVLDVKVPSVEVRGSPGRVVYISGEGPIVVCKNRGVLIANYCCDDRRDLLLKHGSYFAR